MSEIEDIDARMSALRPDWRRWCYAQYGCGCVGCVGMPINRVTREQYIAWLERHGIRTRAEEDAIRDRAQADEQRLWAKYGD